MIGANLERRVLQAAVAAGCLVPIGAGAAGIFSGGAFLKGVEVPVPVDLDSHFRYLSGLLVGIGIGFAACVPHIERRTALFGTLGGIVFVGGLARLSSLAAAGVPSDGHVFGLAMELGAIPLLVLWQLRVARRCAAGPIEP
jgi:hypothetical protein